MKPNKDFRNSCLYNTIHSTSGTDPRARSLSRPAMPTLYTMAELRPEYPFMEKGSRVKYNYILVSSAPAEELETHKYDDSCTEQALGTESWLVNYDLVCEVAPRWSRHDFRG